MRFGALAAVLIVLAAPPALATERMPLPVVDLTAADGRTVRSDAVARAGTWVVLYVHQGCGSCEAPLAAIDGIELSEMASRIAIVADVADPAALASLANRYPGLSGAQWLCDTSGSLGRRIAPQPGAAVVGLERTVIEWSLSGIVTDAAQVRSVVRAWLAR